MACCVAGASQRRDAAHLLEDLRPGGAAPRLGLLPAGDRRRAEPRPRPLQRLPARRRPPAWRRWRTSAHRAARASNNRIWRAWLARQARARSAYRVQPSARQFPAGAISADAGARRRCAFGFLKARGIITRKMGAYGLPDCLRITIGSEDEMRAVAAALADFLAGGRGVHDARAGCSPRRADRHRADRLLACARRCGAQGLAGAYRRHARAAQDTRDNGAGGSASSTASMTIAARRRRRRRSRRGLRAARHLCRDRRRDRAGLWRPAPSSPTSARSSRR